jgi:hypothetical protein
MNSVSLSKRRHLRTFVRTAVSVLLSVFSIEVLLADGGNACCGPAPNTNACYAEGCNHEFPSYCSEHVLGQIRACCGFGTGTATCTRVRDCRPETAWCVRCTVGGQTCGTCQTEACDPDPDPPPTCGEQCNGDPECEECECDGHDWLYWDGAYSCESPILISMSSNTAQYHLTSPQDGVRFDLDGDGVREQISWTAADSSVAFLARDRNANGSIDSGTELFGNYTVKRDGTRARNGFDALADLEDPPYRDGALTPSDSVYSQLLLWIDRDHDGLSSISELSSLSEAGVTRIDTSYVTRRRRDQYGNRYRFEGSAMIIENEQIRPRRVFDVFFVRVQ